MSFRVEITRTAAREVGQRYDQLAERAGASAERWRAGLLEAVESLREHPGRCAQAPEAEWYGEGLRELYYGKRRDTYRILFEIRGDVVFILRVRHGRQDVFQPGELRPPAAAGE